MFCGFMYVICSNIKIKVVVVFFPNKNIFFMEKPRKILKIVNKKTSTLKCIQISYLVNI